MPYSFTQIEKDKSRTITIAFCFLCLLYFSAIWVIALLIKNYSYFESLFVYKPVPFQYFNILHNILIIAFSVILATIHWLFTVSDLTERIIRILKAKDIDSADPRQKMYQNIIEEVSVATGGKKIRGMIIPTMALNACTFGDEDSVPVIAVTKGLLYKLNRNQLEGVVAHETAHVVSGDYVGTTITSSMFEIFGATLRGIRTFFDGLLNFGDDENTAHWHYQSKGYSGRWRSRGNSKSSGDGMQMARGAHLLIFVFAIIAIMWLVNALATLMRMLVSRQREFRADAIAIRLTRYPLGLAEALYIISNRRHSLIDTGDSLQTLFIVNPALSFWDKGEGVFSELFSTHPAISKRIETLLSMAHRTKEDLQKAQKELQAQEEEELKERQKQYQTDNAPSGLWMAKNEKGGWLGPFNLQTLTSFEWVNPQTMVKQVGQTAFLPLLQLPLYVKMMEKDHQQRKMDVTHICPACSGELQDIKYEHITILKCQQCEGSILDENQIGAILHRKEEKFDERIQGMAQALLKEPQINNNQSLIFQESDRQYCCGKCKDQPKKWRKCLFNRYYHIEIDKCMTCGKVWFDKDELEVMQCIFEIRDAQSYNFTPKET